MFVLCVVKERKQKKNSGVSRPLNKKKKKDNPVTGNLYDKYNHSSRGFGLNDYCHQPGFKDDKCKL
jgi:hypothetical protein